MGKAIRPDYSADAIVTGVTMNDEPTKADVISMPGKC